MPGKGEICILGMQLQQRAEKQQRNTDPHRVHHQQNSLFRRILQPGLVGPQPAPNCRVLLCCHRGGDTRESREKSQTHGAYKWGDSGDVEVLLVASTAVFCGILGQNRGWLGGSSRIRACTKPLQRGFLSEPPCRAGTCTSILISHRAPSATASALSFYL